MTPLKIVIVGVLLYIAFRMIFGGRKKNVNNEDGQPRELPAHDVLMEDPVCKSLVPMRQAVVLEHDGAKHYFCSQKCCDAFKLQQGDTK